MFRFRDPLNKELRFIPLRLDETPIKGSLAQFVYINWLPEAREQEYAKLLEACRPPAKPTTNTNTERAQIAEKAIQLDYNEVVLDYTFGSDGKRALSGARDNTMRLWDMETGRCLRMFDGHNGEVNCVVWSADERLAFSCSDDRMVRLWDVETGSCLRVLEGHTDIVRRVAWSPDQRCALSGSKDKTMRLWDVKTGRCLRVFEGHTDGVYGVAWSDPSVPISLETLSSNSLMSRAKEIFNVSRFVIIIEARESITSKGGSGGQRETRAPSVFRRIQAAYP